MVGTANFADVPARIGRTGERVAGANDAAEAAQAKSKRARIGERSVGVGNRTWTDVARKPLLPFTAGTQASLRFEARQTRIRYGASFLAATKTSSARDDVRFAAAHVHQLPDARSVRAPAPTIGRRDSGNHANAIDSHQMSHAAIAAIDLSRPHPGVKLAVGTVVKHPTPLFQQDTPWETRIDNGYPNAMRSPSGTWRLFYGTCEKSCSSQLLLYANSSDGITWHKPSLGLFDLGKVRPDLKAIGKDNNILLQGGGIGVYEDIDATAPSRRFIAFGPGCHGLPRRIAAAIWTSSHHPAAAAIIQHRTLRTRPMGSLGLMRPALVGRHRSATTATITSRQSKEQHHAGGSRRRATASLPLLDVRLVSRRLWKAAKASRSTRRPLRM